MADADLDQLLEYAECGETPNRAAAIRAAVAELRQFRSQNRVTCETCAKWSAEGRDEADGNGRCAFFRTLTREDFGCLAYEPKA